MGEKFPFILRLLLSLRFLSFLPPLEDGIDCTRRPSTLSLPVEEPRSVVFRLVRLMALLIRLPNDGLSAPLSPTMCCMIVDGRPEVEPSVVESVCIDSGYGRRRDGPASLSVRWLDCSRTGPRIFDLCEGSEVTLGAAVAAE